MKGHSIVHINFQQNRFRQYEHGVRYQWYDLFGAFGGLCGLTFGASIVNILEFLYYFTGKFGAHCFAKHFKRMPMKRRSIKKKANNLSVKKMHPICLKEFHMYNKYKSNLYHNWEVSEFYREETTRTLQSQLYIKQKKKKKIEGLNLSCYRNGTISGYK